MVAYYFWLGLAGVVVYAMMVDENVATYVNLFIMGVWIQLRRYYYMVILHPKNPITNWIMERKMNKLAKELLEEHSSKEKE